MNNELYVDEPTVTWFFIGELGWFCQWNQAYMRYLKNNVYQDRKFVLMTDIDKHVLVHDFASYTIGLPQWFYDLKLERDCYESPLPGSPPGSLTPPDVYTELIKYFRQFYNVEKAIEIWTPRGAEMFWPSHKPQMFANYTKENAGGKLVVHGRPFICVSPRGRTRAPQRNVPEYVWRETVDILRGDFTVVLCGTPDGSYLVDYQDENVINLITYVGDDKLEKVMEYYCKSVCHISSQSGPTHVGMLCMCPSYIIGHEMERHAVNENRFASPVSFRYIQDYRCIDAQTIVKDMSVFLDQLVKNGVIVLEEEPIDTNDINTILENDTNVMMSLIRG